MSEQQATAAQANTHAPPEAGPVTPGPGPAPEAVEAVEDQAPGAGPCGCAERVDRVERQLELLSRVARTVGYLAVFAAVGVAYLLWSDVWDWANGGSKST